ncbi:PGDYG domain-containing protein [Desulfovibrio sp. OttesenSCG-928-A18]|nr:PGDYG domain-containing protein [Desulfovibrio sp. OttesenSCG-928-A18]
MNKLQKYRKKPVVIVAFHYTGRKDDFELMRWCESLNASRQIEFSGDGCTIKTLEGDMRADPGDYIICGIKGELYPCKPDIFKATYEAVRSGV